MIYLLKELLMFQKDQLEIQLLKNISEFAKKNNCSLEIASKKLIELNKIKPKTKIGLNSLLNLLEKWRYDLKKKNKSQ